MRFLNQIRPAFTSPLNRFLTRRQFVQLFVGGLSYDTNESVLKDVFEEYGEVIEVKVICDRVSGKSRGYGFVHYSSEAAAAKALIEMNGRLLDGRNIRLHRAHKEESKEVRIPSAGALGVNLEEKYFVLSSALCWTNDGGKCQIFVNTSIHTTTLSEAPNT